MKKLLAFLLLTSILMEVFPVLTTAEETKESETVVINPLPEEESETQTEETVPAEEVEGIGEEATPVEVQTSAATSRIDKRCGDNLSWSMDSGGTLIISGTGDMYDFTYDNEYDEVTAPWDVNQVKKVVVEAGVTSVGDYAFYGSGSLQEVVIGNDVKSIGQYAFDTFPSQKLRSVTLGTGIEFIDFGAFGGGYYVESVHISDLAAWLNIKFDYVGSNPLYGAGACDYVKGYLYLDDQPITNLVIPDGITQIPDYAFTNYDQLTQVTIPASVKTIGEKAFAGCENLIRVDYLGSVDDWVGVDFKNEPFDKTLPSLYIDGQMPVEVTLSDGITAIPRYAFDYCKSLTEISIPKTVKRIETNICDTLTTLRYRGTASDWVGISFSGRLLPDGATLYLDGTIAETLTISDGIDTISNYAFDNCRTLKSITIPDSVTSVGNYSFRNCVALKTIDLPNSMESIGTGAFVDCGILDSVDFGGTKEIGLYAFQNCDGLTEIIIPPTVTKIEDSAFAGCNSLARITLGGQEELLLGEKVFSNCSSVETVLFEGTLIDWLNLSFVTDTSNPCRYGAKLIVDGALLQSVTIPEGVTSINSYAFAGCESLIQVVLPDHVTDVASYAFYKCKNLAGVSLSQSLTDIRAHTFNGCKSLSQITLPDGILDVEEYAFRNSGLSDIQIPSSLRIIKSGAFTGCTALKVLRIPSTVEKLQSRAIPTSVEKVFFEGDLPLLANDSFSGVAAYCYYPAENESYITVMNNNNNDYGGNLFWIPVGVDGGINSEYCGENITWTLSENGCLTLSGTGSMYDYSSQDTVFSPWYDQSLSITSVVIGEGVTSVGDEAFSACSALQSVALPSTLVTIGNDAFLSCESLNEVMIPSSVTAIGIRAFNGCSALTSLTLPENLTSMGEMAFGSIAIRTIVIPDRVSYVGASAFSNCANLTSATVGASVIELPASMFSGCYELNRISLPAGLKKIGDYAFSACYELESFTLPEGLTHIGQGAFSTVGFDSFSSGFGSITLPSTLRYIGDRAFYYNADLRTITFSGGEFELGSQIFSQNQKALTITFQCVAPTFAADTFGKMVYRVTAYYPSNHESWTPDVLQNYGGNVTWIASDMEVILPGGDQIGDGSDQEGGSGSDDGGSDGGDSSGEGNGDCPGHKYREDQVIPNCTEQGYTICTCTLCGHSYTCDYIDALGHTNTYRVNKAPTKSATGLLVGSCSVCSERENVTLPVLDTANYDYTVIEEATTQEAGSGRYTWKETSYGVYFFDVVIPVLSEWIYSIADRQVTITGYRGSDADLAIPEELDGCPVTAIGDGVFRSMQGLTFVTIPGKIKTIGEEAFSECHNMTEIIFAGSAPAFGTNVFAEVTATAYYPYGEPTWTAEVMQNYGGTIAWVTHSGPAGFVISGSVKSYADETATITLELLQNGEVVKTTTTTGNSVTYNIAEVIPGTYTLRVSKANHVTRSYEIVVGSADLEQNVTLLPIGDITGDGKVTATDYSRLLAHVKKTSSITDGYMLACADVTGDGKITATDYSRLLAHVKKVSPLW